MYRIAVIMILVFSVLFSYGCGAEEEAETASALKYELCLVDSIVDNSIDQEFMVGYPADVCFGPSGEILVLDQSAAAVYAFNTGGAFLEQFGGVGEGPGEMGNPMSIEVIEGYIMIRDAVKHGYLLFDSSYELVEEVSHWPSGSPTDMQYCGDSSFAARSTSLGNADDGLFIGRDVSRYTLGAAEPSLTYYSDVSPVDASDPSSILRMGTESLVFTSDPSGRIYVAEITGEEYLVTVYGPHGDTLYTITRDFEPVQKTQAELDEEITSMDAEMRLMGVEGVGNWVPYPLKSMIIGLGTDADMNLWVQRGTEVQQTLDVYNTRVGGELICTVVLPRPGHDWCIRVSSQGIIAWQTDPPDGYFTFYTLKLIQYAE